MKAEQDTRRYISPRLAQRERERALRTLYSNPVFQKSVKLLARTFRGQPLRDAYVRKVFHSRLRLVLSRWGLHQHPHVKRTTYRWLAWLVLNWDPEKQNLPRCPPTIQEPILASWTITYLEHPLNFSAESELHQTHRNAWVRLTFFPGITKNQAEKAVEAALQLANAPMKGHGRIKSKGGRPSLSEIEIDSLVKIFEAVGLPETDRGKRQADKLRQVSKLIEGGQISPESHFSIGRSISMPTLKREYIKWKARKGLPSRRYITSKKDARR